MPTPVDRDTPVTNPTIEMALLANGRPVAIRHAAPGDLDAVRTFYEHLADESTYYRFFGIRRKLPDHELCDIVCAGPHHVTLLAWVDATLVGIGEYIIGNDPKIAEVAFAVADDHHREGIATLLLERLAVIGHDRQLLRFTASVLPTNTDMQLVFRTVGLTERTQFEDGVMEVSLDLSSVAAMHAATASRIPAQRRDPGAASMST